MQDAVCVKDDESYFNNNDVNCRRGALRESGEVLPRAYRGSQARQNNSATSSTSPSSTAMILPSLRINWGCPACEKNDSLR